MKAIEPGLVSCMALMLGLAWHAANWSEFNLMIESFQRGDGNPFVGAIILVPSWIAYAIAAFSGILAWTKRVR